MILFHLVAGAPTVPDTAPVPFPSHSVLFHKPAPFLSHPTPAPRPPADRLTGDDVIAGGERRERVHVPEEDGLVQARRRHVLLLLGVGQSFHVVLVRA